MSASRASRFDRAGFEARYGQQRTQDARPAAGTKFVWPIAREHLLRRGQSVMEDRDGTGRPHYGLDLFARPDTPVVAALTGQVLRVVDGRASERQSLRRAGLFIDVRCEGGRICRYQHLGSARVAPGEHVPIGTVLGTVAEPFTSGLAESPHLHFEVRQGDYDGTRRNYGEAIDPLTLLPPLRT